MAQCLTANYDSAGHCDPAALGGIEHPLRNLESRDPTFVIGWALEHERAVPTPHRLYADASSMPRMEWISNLTNIVNMGVSLPGCITTDCRNSLAGFSDHPFSGGLPPGLRKACGTFVPLSRKAHPKPRSQQDIIPFPPENRVAQI